MYKVLFVIDTLEIGGTEQSLLDNVTRLQQITPVVCHLYQGDSLKPRFTQKGIKVWSAGIGAKYGWITACNRLSHIVGKEQPDLIVAYLTRSELVGRIVAKWHGVPVVGTFVSDLYAPVYNGGLSRKAKAGVSFFRFLNKCSARFCSGFIANSETIKMANAAHLGIAPERIQVIHRGRDAALFQYKQPCTNGREQANDEPKGIRFLNVGRLVPVKNQAALIKAFSNYLPHDPEAILHIAGEGPRRVTLAGLVRKYGLEEKVVLLGARQDLPYLLHGYDCFVFPTRSEGFSGAVVEAMLTGLPVLASDISVNREVVTHGHTGYLFNNDSSRHIADAMLWYKQHTAQAADMALRAYQHALNHFELGITAAKLENYLLKIITHYCDYPAPGTKTAVARR